MPLGEINIEKVEIEPVAFVENYQTRLYLQYASIISKTEMGKQLVKRLDDDPRVAALKGKQLSRGSSAETFQTSTLAMWFLWYANENGKQNAIQELESFLNADTVPVLNTLWVFGVSVDEPLD
jgi:hypothetical protein